MSRWTVPLAGFARRMAAAAALAPLAAGGAAAQTTAQAACPLVAEIGEVAGYAYVSGFTQDRLLVSAGKSLTVFGTPDWTPRLTLADLATHSLSPDGKTLLAVQNGQASLWDLATGQAAATLGPSDYAQFHLDYIVVHGAIKHNRVAAGARILRRSDLLELVRFNELPHVSLDHEAGLAAGYHGVLGLRTRDSLRDDLGKPDVVIWDLAAAKQVTAVRHAPWPTRVEIGGGFVETTNSFDKEVYLWSVADGERVRSGEYARFWSQRIPGGRLFRPADSNKDDNAFALLAADPDTPIEIPGTAGASWVGDSTWPEVMYVKDGRVVIWNTATGTEVRSIPAPGIRYPWSVSDNRILLVHDSRIGIYDRETGRLTYIAGDEAGYSESLRFAITSSKGAAPVTVYDAKADAVVCTAAGAEHGVRAQVSSDGAHLAVVRQLSADYQGAYGVAVYRAEQPPSAEQLVAQAQAKSAALTPEQRQQATLLLAQGFELFKAGEFDAAVLRFRQGLDIDPANGIGHFYLAETYVRQQKAELAREHYTRTIGLAPTSKEAAIAQVRLQN